MGKWMKEWGQFFVILGALGGLFGFIRGDMIRMEDRLGARMDRIESRMDRIEGVIVENGKAVARLEVRVTRVEDDVTWLRNNR